MYIPDHFRPADDEVRALLRRPGAVDLVTSTERGLMATRLPMAWDEPGSRDGLGAYGALVGHVAIKNDQWREPAIGDAMAIISGPDAYITPSWYEAKREHGRVVPTWNYILAHAHGRFVVHEDAGWLEANVRRLVTQHEASRERPWSVDDAPDAYIAGQLRAIVGVELLIDRLDAKWKLSQNRSAADIEGVIAGLEAEGETGVSALMRAGQDRG
jgi:transcriptional regulator